MMPFAIAAAVSVITVAAAEISGFGADALTSTAPGPTKSQVTTVTEANPTIDDLDKKLLAMPVKPDVSEAVSKVDAEISPATVVAAEDGVPEDPDPIARFDMKYGTDDENSTDWMK